MQIDLVVVLSVSIPIIVSIMAAWINLTNRISKLESETTGQDKDIVRIQNEISELKVSISEMKNEMNTHLMQLMDKLNQNYIELTKLSTRYEDEQDR